MTAKNTPGLRRLLLLIATVLAIPIVPFAVIGELPGERWLSAADGHSLAFGAAGAGLLAADVLLPVPSTIVGSLLGARLGFWHGWLWSWLGLVAGNLVGYTAGRLLLGRLGKKMPRAPTLLILFASRPVPVLAEAVTFAAGATRLGLLPFLAVAIPANGLLSAALAGNGAALLPRALAGPGLALPMLLPVVGWLIWQWLARDELRGLRTED